MLGFIFESIGTSELMLIGLLALIFLGPRKMPEMARKLGKLMQEFRGTANEFKETWQREVDLSAEIKSLEIEESEISTVARVQTITAGDTTSETAPDDVLTPTVREIDPAEAGAFIKPGPEPAEPDDTDDPNDRKNWL